MSDDPSVYLRHILLAINALERYVSGVSAESFVSDDEKGDACIYQLAIIGEAVKHLPESVRRLAPSIDWKAIGGMRDVLVHEYFGVDRTLIWSTITNDIPPLKEAVRRFLSEM